MAFKVKFAQNTEKDYSDDDKYDFEDGGVLKITFGNTAQWTEYHAPGTWEQVLAEHDHRKGKTAGRGGAAVLR
ncbi:hypothetical protein [Mycolicibacter arupensis]|jgi:hypothetical protein|uniref:Uncharacterized protein n=1 Tax=Mycolicibacter arupensis TaxID=342002 RepID=A0A5C7XLB5_9MYCO|nr:hypothetical protein [Mycolicibacter arupensis]TXI50195.1 MAG: hypothetical protein E6Q54_21745 [Mycolicibacter arupensis]